MDRTQREGTLYIFLAVLGYSILPTLTKLMLAAGLEPPDIATWRFLFAAPAMWLIIALGGNRSPTPSLPRVRLLAMGAMLAVTAMGAFFALTYLHPSTFIVLFYTYPAIVAVMMLMQGERLPPVGWFALAMTLVGVALTAPDFSSGLSGDNLRGVMLALTNAAIVAVYFVINSRLLRGHTSMGRASAWAITGALAVMLAVALRRPLVFPSDLKIWFWLLVLALVCTVLPVFALTTGINKLGPVRASILGTVEPVLTTLWALLFLPNERIEPIQIVGAAFILGSVILLQLHRSQPSGKFKVEVAAS